MGVLEYKFATFELAREFADDRGVDSVTEKYFASGKVEFVVKVVRYG